MAKLLMQRKIVPVIAIILLRGHCKVPCRELYWAVALDTLNAAVPNAKS